LGQIMVRHMCASRLGDHEEAIDFIMDAPGISPRHLVRVIDAGLVSLPGRAHIRLRPDSAGDHRGR
jgi:hypothetical protein